MMNRVGPQVIEDVLRTVYVVAKPHASRDYTYLMMSASRAFQESTVCSDAFIRPGLWRQRGSGTQAKRAILGLRQLGYYVEVYKQQELADWYASFDDIPVDDADTHDSVLSTITKKLPNCQTYVELFGAGTSLLARRDPASVEVYNDRSSHVVNFFRVLRSPSTFSWFFILSRLFPVSSPLERAALRTFVQGTVEGDAVLMAYAWYCNLRPRLPTYLLNPTADSEEGQIAAILAAVDPSFPWVRHRLMRVQYEHNSWQKTLDIYDSQGTLFWVDVPSRGFEHLSVDDTHLLLRVLNEISGAVALYIDHSDPNEVVAKALRSEVRRKGSRWRSKKYKTCTLYQKPNR